MNVEISYCEVKVTIIDKGKKIMRNLKFDSPCIQCINIGDPYIDCPLFGLCSVKCYETD